MKVAGQQHYEIDGEAKELTPILNDWYEKVAAALKATHGDKRIHITMMMEATND